MEKGRRIKVLSLVVLIIAVLGLTVAFAALSQTLTINGTANIDAATWDIHFENFWENTSGGKLNAEPVITGTTITGIDATITKPGDYAGLFVDIVNDGTVNAKISSVEMSKLCTLTSPVESCDWDNDGTVTQSDIDKVNDNISFIMAYTDDVTGGNALHVNDILNSGVRKRITAIINYGKYTEVNGSYIDENSYTEATELPKRDLVFNDLSITINYVQAD